MSLPNDLKSQEESAELGGIPGMSVNSPTQFEYIPSKDWFTAPETDDFKQSLDPEIVGLIDGWSNNVNTFAVQPIGNMNSPYPTEATDTYNPYAQNTPADPSTAEGSQRNLDAFMHSRVDMSELAPKKTFIETENC